MRSTVWVGDIQFGGRRGGGNGDERSILGEIDNMGRGKERGGAEFDNRTRETMKQGV